MNTAKKIESSFDFSPDEEYLAEIGGVIIKEYSSKGYQVISEPGKLWEFPDGSRLYADDDGLIANPLFD